MRLGVDIDGVVADSYPFWLGELNRYYGKDIKAIHRYEMHLIFDVPWEHMNQFFVANVENLFMAPTPMPGARTALAKLSIEHEIILVTARREVEEEITRRWLELHQIPFTKLMVVGDRSKAEVCAEEGIDLFVEDYAINAALIAASGMPVLILDATYNRVELPQNVIRCYNWGQIYQTILKLGAQ
ncbi:MAG: hypothetical protein M0Z55_03060 [Peptococcaceae bacterium]|nr:hypothetical protein [Peptococcaceae bacterium]